MNTKKGLSFSTITYYRKITSLISFFDYIPSFYLLFIFSRATFLSATEKKIQQLYLNTFHSI